MRPRIAHLERKQEPWRYGMLSDRCATRTRLRDCTCLTMYAPHWLGGPRPWMTTPLVAGLTGLSAGQNRRLLLTLVSVSAIAGLSSPVAAGALPEWQEDARSDSDARG